MILRSMLLALGLLFGLNTLKAQAPKSEGKPTYVETGNQAVDEANYARAKEAWIKDNPAEYQKIVDRNAAAKTAVPAGQQVNSNATTQPKVVTKEQYNSAPSNLQQFMREHPEQYKIEGIKEINNN
jgi:hypothetical protein